jgi:hypothetical protein
MQHQAQIDAALRSDGSYDYSHCFSLVKERLSRADLAIGNLEVTLGGEPYRGYPQFSAPDEYLYAIKDAGFDILATANNHSLDRRRRGLERTLTLIDSAGLHTVGTYRDTDDRAIRYPLIVEKNGLRLAFLCATYGTNGITATPPNIVNSLDREELAADIHTARTMRADVLIAIVHWGNEYQQQPTAEQRDLARWLISQGVDHVIGSHPHVVQPIELLTSTDGTRQTLCAYSLGNFLSNQRADNIGLTTGHSEDGLMLRFTLSKYSNGEVFVESAELIPTWVLIRGSDNNKSYQIIPLDYNVADWRTAYDLSSTQGVDNQLIWRAQQQEKEILDVESGLFQTQMLMGFSDGLQEQLLYEAVYSDPYEYADSIRELFEMWCSGNETELIEYLTEEPDYTDWTDEEIRLMEEYNNAMGTDRNDDMHDVAVGYLESGDVVFYAVGLAHLLETDGLVNTLRDAGYTVELVTFE